MLAIIRNDLHLWRRLQIISSIPGIGVITAIALIVEIPELGALKAKQAASLSGLAPHPREPGQWKGTRFIQTALREWAHAGAYQTSEQRKNNLPNWTCMYNWHRPTTV